MYVIDLTRDGLITLQVLHTPARFGFIPQDSMVAKINHWLCLWSEHNPNLVSQLSKPKPNLDYYVKSIVVEEVNEHPHNTKKLKIYYSSRNEYLVRASRRFRLNKEKMIY